MLRGPPSEVGTSEAAAGDTPPGRQLELEEENWHLRRALASRPVIDIARGVLTATYHCSPDQAWDILVRASQHTNVKLRLIAQALVDTTQGKELRDVRRAQVTAAVDAVCGPNESAGSAFSTDG